MKVTFTFILLLVTFSVNAFGEGGDLASPEIGVPAGIDETQKENVYKIIEYMRDDLTFIEGSFVNEFSYLRFGATSAQVSDFIALLNQAGLWEVQIRFQDFGEQDSAFSLSQSSPNLLHIIVNSGREDFLLKDFIEFFPGIAAPVEDTSKAQQDGAVQPATDPESKSEDNEKPKPETEVRPQ
jgi:hypothetical protein